MVPVRVNALSARRATLKFWTSAAIASKFALSALISRELYDLSQAVYDLNVIYKSYIFLKKVLEDY